MKYRALWKKGLAVILAASFIMSQNTMLLSEVYADEVPEVTEAADGEGAVSEDEVPGTVEDGKAVEENNSDDGAAAEDGEASEENDSDDGAVAEDGKAVEENDSEGEAAAEDGKAAKENDSNGAAYEEDPQSTEETDDAASNEAPDESSEGEEPFEVSENQIVISENTIYREENEETEEDGEMVVGGYIEMPWDNDTPVVDENLDYSDAIDEIVNEPRLMRNRYVSEPESIQAKFPEGTESEILSYLKDTYPATRSQSPYGSCWAHSAMALSEYYLIKHGLSDSEGAVDKTVNYSELQLAYFCYNQAPNPVMGDTGDRVNYKKSSKDFLNFGGNLDFAAQSLMRYNGVTTDENDAAYSNAASVLQNGLNDEYASSKDVSHLKNEYMISIRENPKLVKQAILENGIVGVSFYANDSYLNSSTNSYFNNVNTGTNHAVAIVGWDDNYAITNFKSGRRPGKSGAWLVRNSWTTDTRFSYYSYFWLSYEDTSLNDTAYIFEMAAPEEFYDNNYYYDSQLHSVSTAPANKVANVFSVKGSAKAAGETLNAVQLDTTLYGNVKYKIQIFRNLSDASDPESGEEVSEAKTEGTLPFAGKYTIPLNSAVSLSRGELFSVVITTTGGRIDRETSYDWADNSGNTLEMKTAIGRDESFYYSGSAWKDMATAYQGNLCIRALTSDVGGASLPEKIGSLSVRNKTESTVSLAWSEAGNAEGYEIWYSEEKNGAYTKAGETPADERKFTHTGLEGGGTYYYKVYPVRNGSISEKDVSPVVSVTTLAAVPDVEITYVGNYSARVKWEALSNCDGYELNYGEEGSNSLFSLGRLEKDDTEQLIKYLSPNRTYFVEVRSYLVDPEGVTTYGEYCRKTFKTNNGTGTAVTNLKATPLNENYIRLSWDQMEEASAYMVEKSADGKEFSDVFNGYFVNNVVNVGNLDRNTKYYFRVTSLYRTYEGEETFTSDSVSAYTKLPAVGELNVELRNGGKTVTIVWSPVEGANYYSVYRKSRRDDDYLPLALIAASDELKYEDKSLIPGSAYSYKVFPCRTNSLTDEEGVSDKRLGITMPLANPTGLSITELSVDSVLLSWSAVEGAEGYEIGLKKNGDTDFTTLGEVSADILEYNLTGLSLNTQYTVKVSPFTSDYRGGGSGFSFRTSDLENPSKNMFRVEADNAVFDGLTHGATVTSTDSGINQAGITIYYAPVTNGIVGSYNTAKPINAGIYQVKLQTKKTDRYSAVNYTDESWRFTVSPAPSSVSVAPAGKDLTYNKNGQDLVTAGEAAGGTLQYKLGADGTYGKAVPKATDAGDYTVYYKVIGDSNHNDSQEESITVTIKQAGHSNETTIGSAKFGHSGEVDLSSQIEAGGSLKDGSVSVTEDPESVLDGDLKLDGNKLKYSFINDQSKAGCTAVVTVGVNGGKNYKDYSITVTLTVNEKPAQVVDFSGINGGRLEKTYGDEDFAEAVTVTSGDGAISYSSSRPEVATVDGNGKVHIIKAGETVITAVAAETDEYAEGKSEYSLSVKKKQIIVSGIKATNKEYDGSTSVSLNYVSVNLNGKKSGDDLSVEADGAFTDAAAGENKAVNITNIRLTGSGIDNYELSPSGQQSVTYAAIEKKIVGLSWGETEFIYDGDPHTPLAEATGVIDGDECKVTVSGEGTDAGEHIAIAWSLSNSNYKLSEKKEIVFKIKPADIGLFTAPLAVADLTYNGTEQKLVKAGSADGGTLRYAVSEKSAAEPAIYSDKIPTKKNAGNYTVYYYVRGDNNHNDTAVASVDVEIDRGDYPEDKKPETVIQTPYTTKKLSQVALPSGWTWSDGDKDKELKENEPLTAIAVYNAADKNNYKEDGLSVEITVTRDGPVRATGVRLNQTSAGILVGKTITLAATVLPDDAYDKRVSWKSSNTGIASVSQTGVVKGVSGGTAVITVTTNDGKYSATCKVTVTVPVTGVKLNKTAATIVKGKTLALTAAITPSNATNKAVSWKSSNTKVATVSSKGVVTAVNGGTANITVTTTDGKKSAVCKVTVTVPVSSVKLNKTKASVVRGYTLTLTPTIAPSNATNKAVSWKSSNTKIATVTSKGVVKGIKVGTANITVTTTDGKKTAVCKVTVTNPVAVKSVKLNKTKASVVRGYTFTLTPTIAPSNATNKAVSWKSSNTKIATVTSKGVVKGVKAGTANITVTTADGKKTAVCKVTVTNPITVKSVKLNVTKATLKKNQSVTLKATINPSNATNKTVAWKSSNTKIATVTSKGVVKGIKAGTASITVTTADGRKTAVCKITVK